MREVCKAINHHWFETLRRPLMQVPKAIANQASRTVSQQEGMRMIETRHGEFVSGPMQVEVWGLRGANGLLAVSGFCPG